MWILYLDTKISYFSCYNLRSIDLNAFAIDAIKHGNSQLGAVDSGKGQLASLRSTNLNCVVCHNMFPFILYFILYKP